MTGLIKRRTQNALTLAAEDYVDRAIMDAKRQTWDRDDIEAAFVAGANWQIRQTERENEVRKLNEKPTG